MNTLLIFATSISSAYVVARRSGRGEFTLADLVIGLLAGVAGLGIASLGIAGAEWRSGLPIFFAFALVLGLESLPRRSLWR